MRRGPVLLGAVALAAAFAAGLPMVRTAIQHVRVPIRGAPEPDGSFSVGRTTVSVPMRSEASASELAIDVWYPRQTGSSPAGAGAPPALSDARPFPLLLYAPGWNDRSDGNTRLAAGLASRGYVVAAINDAGWRSRLSVHGGPESEKFDLDTEAALERSLAVAARRLQQMVRRVMDAIDGLLEVSRGVGTPLAGGVDPNKIGMLGFSFGGSVAAEASWYDPRLRAVANMDGWMFGHAAEHGANVPYLVLNSHFPDLEQAAASKATSRRLTAMVTTKDRALQRRLVAQSRADALLFEGTVHGDFTDDLFSPTIITYLRQWSRGAGDRIRLHRAIEAHLHVFFDRNLKGHQATSERRQQIESWWPVVRLEDVPAMSVR